MPSDPEMSRLIPEGLTVEGIDAFQTALHEELTTQARSLRDVPVEERDLDRPPLRAIFDKHGFGEPWQYRGVDFSAPLPDFLAQLEHADSDQLGTWKILCEAYPDGMLNHDDFVPVDLPDDWHPDD